MVQIDGQSIQNGLSYVGGGLAVFLTVIGFGAVFLYVVKTLLPRVLKRKDDGEALHATNQGKQLDSDSSLREDLMNRIDKLEAKIDALQSEVNSHMKENAEFKADNNWLKRENERLTTEVEKLREDRRTADKIIAELRVEVNTLKLWATNSDTAHATTPDDPLNVKIVE